MMKSYARLLPLALLLTACEQDTPVGSSEAAFLRADVTGTVQARYEGTGEFWTGGSAELGRPMTFGINSRVGTSASNETVSLWSQRDGRPAVGNYALRLPDYSKQKWESFAAVYHHGQGNSVESFVAESGTLRITSSSADRIEGTFEFTGVRYCARSATERSGSCTPSQVDLNAPRISVSGSFVAVPSNYTAETRPLRP